MKFDPSKPHGLVYGDLKVRYVQDGHHFDAAGRCLDPATEAPKVPSKKTPAPAPAPEAVAPEPTPAAVDDAAVAFLKNILKDGPLTKATIYKVCSDENQVWDDVKNAAALLGVQKTPQKGQEVWKLPA